MNLVYNKNDILIYDKSEYLTKIVKHYCRNNIEIILCTSKKELAELNFNTINTAFISSNERFDLADIVFIYQYVDKLYVNTQSKELKEKLEILEDVIFFDLYNDKFEVMNKIFNKIIGFD